MVKNVHKIPLLILIFLTVCSPLFAQEVPDHDVLYKTDGDEIACEIKDVLGDRIRYIMADNPTGPVYNIAKPDVLLAIKSNGSFMTPQNPAKQWVQASSADIHKIVTADLQIIPATFLESNGDVVNYQESGSNAQSTIKKNELLALVYKTGEIALIAPTEKVADGFAKINSFTSFSSEAVRDQLNLDQTDYQHFTELALDKADKLGFYLGELCSKAADDFDKKTSEENALKLFKHDSTWVEVSSLNRDEHKRYTIREYLRRIRMLDYDQVELLWRNIDYITKLQKGVDGNYYGIITIQQLFRGFKDGQVAYQDVTQKDIEVMLKTYKLEKEGKVETVWDVFLSDIGVQQTKEK